MQHGAGTCLHMVHIVMMHVASVGKAHPIHACTPQVEHLLYTGPLVKLSGSRGAPPTGARLPDAARLPDGSQATLVPRPYPLRPLQFSCASRLQRLLIAASQHAGTSLLHNA